MNNASDLGEAWSVLGGLTSMVFSTPWTGTGLLAALDVEPNQGFRFSELLSACWVQVNPWQQ